MMILRYAMMVPISTILLIILCFSIYGEGADFSRRKERLELIEKRKKVIEIVIRTFEMF